MGLFNVFRDLMGRSKAGDYITLSQPVTSETIKLSNNGFATCVKINGPTTQIVTASMAQMIINTATILSSRISRGGHQIHFYYEFNPSQEAMEEYLRGKLAGSIAKFNSLDIDSSFLEARIKANAKHCFTESFRVIVYSPLTLLSKTEMETEKARNDELGLALHEGQTRRVTGALGFENLLSKHEEAVKGIVEAFNTPPDGNVSLSLNAEPMNIQEWLGDLAKLNGASGEESVFFDSLNYPEEGLVSGIKEDIDAFLAKPLSAQITRQVLRRRVPGRIYEQGDHYYGASSVKVGPQEELLNFSHFRRYLQNTRIPCRITFALLPPKAPGFSFEMSRYTKLLSQNSNRLDLARTFYEKRVKTNAAEHVNLQISAVTWSPVKDGIRVANNQREKLVNAFQAWGGMECKAEEGDTVKTHFAASPGATQRSTGSPLLAPCTDASWLLPHYNSFFPIWSKGGLLLRTPSGTPFPYKSLTHQDADVILINGGMGSGKSTFLNVANLAFVGDSTEAEDLPFVSILDVGGSSRGGVRKLLSTAPEHIRKLVKYERFKNDPAYAVNIMEPPLGLRSGTASDLSFIYNYLTMLVTHGSANYPSATREAIVSGVKQVFNKCSDMISGGAKRFVPDIDARLTKALQRAGYEYHEATYWWQIVDFFVEREEWDLASIAHRQASPNLNDLLLLIKSDEFIKGMRDEQLTNFLVRKLEGILSEFKYLAGPSVFDTSRYKYLALDLDDITRSAGEGSREVQAGYAFATRILTQKFWVHTDLLPEYEKLAAETPNHSKIYKFHRDNILEIMSTPKQFVADELHRGTGTEASVNPSDFARLMDQFIAEARKWLIRIVLASQIPSSFTKAMIALATTKISLGGHNSAYKKAVCEAYDWPDYANEMMSRTRPTSSKGSHLIFNAETVKGPILAHLMLTESPEFIWETTTKRLDQLLVERLSTIIGYRDAIKMLVLNFPSCTAVEDIKNAVAAEMGGSYSDADESELLEAIEGSSKPIETLAQNITKKFYALKNSAAI